MSNRRQFVFELGGATFFRIACLLLAVFKVVYNAPISWFIVLLPLLTFAVGTTLLSYLKKYQKNLKRKEKEFAKSVAKATEPVVERTEFVSPVDAPTELDAILNVLRRGTEACDGKEGTVILSTTPAKAKLLLQQLEALINPVTDVDFETKEEVKDETRES